MGPSRAAVILSLFLLCSLAWAEERTEWPGYATEKVGGVALKASEAAALKVFGEPTERGMVMKDGATHLWTSLWKFDHGVSAFFEAETKKGPFRVHLIHLEAPSTLKTAAGIGIGSTLDDVKKAYGKYLTHPKRQPERFWLIGTVEAGMQLMILDGKVASLVYGPLR